MPVRVSWLGQSGVLLEHDGTSVLVDPWLSDHPERAAPAPVLASWPEAIDLVLITHGHGDHLDIYGLAALARRVTLREIAAPQPHVHLLAEALPNIPLISTQPGIDVPRLGGMSVLPAWHGVNIADGYSPMIDAQGVSPHVGYAFTLGGVPLYISGDTIPDPDLTAQVAALRPQMVLLPVNGRDAEREAGGILGNMDAQEAVDFAVATRAQALVPLHYDGVTGNLSDVAMVVQAARGRPVDIIVAPRNTPFDFIGKQT